MLRFLGFAILLVSFATPSRAAKSDDQIWTTASVNVKLSDRWRLSQEIVGRFSDNRNGLYEIEYNALIGYKLNRVATVWAGYTHDPQYAAGHFTVMEHGAREQITFDNFAKLAAGEAERSNEGPNSAGAVARTARVGGCAPYLKYSMPLAGKVALNLSNETFVNLDTTSFQARTGVDRMRNLLSISGPLTKKVSGEFGYMNQHGFVRHGPDTSDNIAYFALGLSL